MIILSILFWGFILVVGLVAAGFGLLYLSHVADEGRDSFKAINESSSAWVFWLFMAAMITMMIVFS